MTAGIRTTQPQPWNVPAVPAELDGLMCSLTDGDAGRVLQSQRLGYGYLSSDFDSRAAAHLSAVLCHLHRALNRCDTDAQRAYHRDLAAGYTRLALTEAAAA